MDERIVFIKNQKNEEVIEVHVVKKEIMDEKGDFKEEVVFENLPRNVQTLVYNFH